ncbi:Hypothetical predicted protein [Olea europaea subsp. europaea]|uniref:Uncharacterized protein n=1 Tax=Olea europaea subsp. europaea TaxID=158383 RepID=A0A8S0Q889_OLEEU|nr:Hypothetical predicted protein [Olea europaea subsp. europaea]
MAIGRAMTQVAVSIKEVHCEMKELKLPSFDLADEASDIISHVSETVAFIKELIRLFKQESGDGCSISTVLLEKLLVLSQGIGVQVDEVGTCFIHREKFLQLRLLLEKISSVTCETEFELGNPKASSNDFVTHL